MNFENISYIFGISIGLILILQYFVFYLFLIKRNEIIRRNKKELILMMIVGGLIVLFSFLGLLFENIKNIDPKPLIFIIKIYFSILFVVFFVILIRNMLLSIKDSIIVETDGYKEFTNKYKLIFSIISGIFALFILLSGLISKFNKIFYYITSLLFIIYLSIISYLENFEFKKIYEKEKGKITYINSIKLTVILFSIIISFIFWGIDTILFILSKSIPINYKNIFYMLGVYSFSIGLLLNIIFDYLDSLNGNSILNKNLSDLKKQVTDEVRTAQSLQISLLPLDRQKEIQKFIDIEISYMPMQSVGGDYYDFYNLDNNNILVMIGDASGHGIYAAMIWAILKVEVEELIEEKKFTDLADAFTILNRRITKILENTYSYATLFSCLINIENKRITYISAGHTDQLFYSREQRAVNLLKNKNPIVGTFRNAKFSADVITAKKGDVILLFSDGVLEGLSPSGEQLGLERLENMFLEVCNEEEDSSMIITKLLMKLEDFFEGTQQQDDRTLMVFKL